MVLLWWQDDDTALEQALSMSMASAGTGVAAGGDSHMAESSLEDPDLALGEFGDHATFTCFCLAAPCYVCAV